MERWAGKIAIVTGASSGIGAAIAEQFVQHGLIVVGFARRAHKIEELSKKLKASKAKGELHACKVDMSEEDQILKGFEWVKKNLGVVHILVNNAGVIHRTNLYDGDLKLLREIVNVNLIAVAIATKEAITVMKENNVDGHIVHMNSIAGRYCVDLPNLSIYPATKHGVSAMTDTLRKELVAIGSKIKVSSISPGAVRTQMIVDNSNPELKESLEFGPMLEPKDIADSVVFVVGTPPHVQIHELTIKPVGEKI